ncbi:tyrosine-protein phosphatase [Nocardia donostiensis]|uniref:Protein tyrosine phosphatase n=1 Tax=Nocardia donostiensis TaxID=1538463 RepID=A0A1W0B1J4_9NOCA|nr:tyrosine-protein phosphatase [Nocardia donostiensis]ONM48528.1 hypothetical protein B0T46_11935 [Nocardia donostiensis]OQS16403.1 hypothetical protein B0T36_05275 [Nocardia donostiensis]OQS17852.1 hypothetical protein B0T44_22700 [Nocardia donostiensis]
MSRIALVGPQNCRDLTGIAARDGATIRPNRVFRSDALNTATDADLQKLTELGVGTVIDFRSDTEAGRRWDRIPEGTRYVRLPINAGNLSALLTRPDGPPPFGEALAEVMRSINRQFVTEAAFRAQFAAALHHIAAADRGVLYHCTAGKDRTGWMSVIVLTVLGVEETTITDDYLLSNKYASPELVAEVQPAVDAGRIPSIQAVAPVIYQHPSYLQAGLDQAEHTYGGMDTYLREGLGFSPSALADLRALLTEA